jgi:hypothetical protein
MIQADLSDFSSTKLKEKKESDIKDQKIMDYLSKIPTKELADNLRKDPHPKPVWKESEEDETWRYYYLQEFKRRGLQIYKDLGWPYDPDSLYVNRWTGGVEKLKDVATSNGAFEGRQNIENQSWSVVENWEPYDPSKRNETRIKYLKESINQEEGGYSSETRKEMRKELYIEENRVLSRDA